MSPLLILVVALLVIVLVTVRQCQERPAKGISWLILIVVVGGLSIERAWGVFANPPVSSMWLALAAVAGLLAGTLIGFARGKMAFLRIDPRTGIAYSRANVLSIIIWLLLLVLRVAVLAVPPSLQYTSALFALAAMAMNTLFLSNLASERATVFWRASTVPSKEEQLPQSQLY